MKVFLRIMTKMNFFSALPFKKLRVPSLYFPTFSNSETIYPSNQLTSRVYT